MARRKARIKPLRAQVIDRYDAMFSPGESKNAVKQEAYEKWNDSGRIGSPREAVNAAIRGKIYSYETYHSYKQQAFGFVDWCKEEHGCKTLKDCRQYVDEYLTEQVEHGGRNNGPASAWTLKLQASALGKLFQEPASNFRELPERHYSDVKRSRGYVESDNHFSLSRNTEIINFGEATGLRRSELAAVRGDQCVQVGGKWYIHVMNNQGKGGRERLAPIVGPHAGEVIARCQAAGHEPVWGHVNSHMDEHHCRGIYAAAIYEQTARPISEIPYDCVNKGTGRRYQSEVYHCRGAGKGQAYDKLALREVSRALGHADDGRRNDTVCEHYAYEFLAKK